ncbi:hypothetical protein V496_04060 [Pseudogymnoascus sp. VKM F-4515 (FW-2607)]|nr:hypothetical protein V496_04060 [Pseudogymnoascus sp. VKM F-4515 (FW-2607)]KFY91507.1 hypothetical protein V498_05425 [Pseudogymnoascus sp. VKM F-4517 (FW-2822)]
MSITQTYYLAHSARGKLSTEASRSDHRLRRLVGHANLLDSLMLELADAEAEQESWFNASVRGARKTSESERHVQWADSVVEEPEEDWRVEDAESDESSDEEEEEDVDMGFATLQRVKSHHAFDVTISSPADEEEEEEIYDDGEEDYAMLSLQRTHSHPASPPDLIDEDDSSSSEDESMPPSPPADILHSFPEDEARRTKASPAKGQFFDEGFYLPAAQRTLVSAVSVY